MIIGGGDPVGRLGVSGRLVIFVGGVLVGRLVRFGRLVC